MSESRAHAREVTEYMLVRDVYADHEATLRPQYEPPTTPHRNFAHQVTSRDMGRDAREIQHLDLLSHIVDRADRAENDALHARAAGARANRRNR